MPFVLYELQRTHAAGRSLIHDSRILEYRERAHTYTQPYTELLVVIRECYPYHTPFALVPPPCSYTTEST